MAMNKQRRTSNINNIVQYDAAGNVTLPQIANANVDTDKFIVSDGGVIRYRTGAQVLEDIAAQGALTLTTNDTTGPATLVGNVLNIPQYSSAPIVYQTRKLSINGTEYDLSADRSWSVGTITALTGEVTASGTGSVAATISNAAVISKTLTGLSISGASITSSDTILSAMGKLQSQINILTGSLIYKGSWNASTNTPTITNGTGIAGNFYIVTTAGTTNIDGTASWAIGDWVIFNGTIWERVPNTNTVVSVNTYTGAVVLTTTDIGEGTNLYFTNERAQNAITGAASTIKTADLTVSRALISNASGKVAVSAVTTTELGYVAGVTSAIQTQIDSKEPTIAAAATDPTLKYWRGDKTWQTLPVYSFNSLSPMTTLGDIIYGGASGAGTRLAGNTLNSKRFLTQTGNGTTSAAPSWAALVSADIPNNAADTSGNAGSATKLATARTLTIGATGRTFDGTVDRTWTLADIGAAPAGDLANYLPLTGGILTSTLTVTATNTQAGIVIKNTTPNPDKSWDISPFGNNLHFNESDVEPVLVLKGGGGDNVRLYNYTDNGFLKTSGGDGTLTVDTTSYLTGNQSITLSGDVSGTGSTSIPVTIGAGKVTNAMLVNSSFHIGKTSISLGRASANQSIDGIIGISGTVAAVSGSATGLSLAQTLTAAANNDTLIAVNIAPTFTNGSFTNVTNIALRVVGNATVTGTITGTLSGNASTASAWATGRTITIGATGKTVNGSGDVSWSLAEIGAQAAFGSQTANRFYAAPNGANGAPTFRAIVAEDIPTLNQNTTGSAASLTTSRNINGTAFNGTAAITTASWGTARTITIGATGKSVDGSGNVSWSLAEIGAASSGSLGSYLPLSGGTITGNLTVSQILTHSSSYGITDSSTVRILSPGGGAYVTTTSSITGALRIKLPVLNSNTMMRFTVKIYEYSTGRSFEVVVGGYNSGSLWYNVFAYLNSDERESMTVRFGNDGGANCVWIGETNTSWSYPQVFVTDVQLGYSGYSTAWTNNFIISFETGFNTVNTSRTAYRKLDFGNAANSATINASTGVNANDIVRRDGSGYIYANYINFSPGVENPAIANIFTDNGDGWTRKSSLAHVKNSIRGIADGTWGINISGSATSLTSGNYILQTGSTGSWNADFQNTPAGSYRYGGDVDANTANNPGGTWWIQQNFRHTNGSNYWGTQVAWGWEDSANSLATRNVTGGSFGSWVYYLNSLNFSNYALTVSTYQMVTGQKDFNCVVGAKPLMRGNNGSGWMAFYNIDHAGPSGLTYKTWDFAANGAGTGFAINESGISARLELYAGGGGRIYGNLTADAFFESSDIRYKNIIHTNPNISLEIDLIKFNRTDVDTDRIRYGYSAQQVKELMPELVSGDDKLSVNYMDIHSIKIAALERRIKELEAKLK
jgi:hypothetical protein